MAYEYGSGEMSFDEQKTGKHVSFQVGYPCLEVCEDGQCKVAATMVKPVKALLNRTSFPAPLTAQAHIATY